MDDSNLFTMTGSEAAGYIDGLIPGSVIALSRGALGSRAEVEREVDEMLIAVREFWHQEPDQVMRQVAAYSARCTELEVHLQRVETTDRSYKQIRTMQVVKLRDELDRQFRLASRMVELRRQDLEHLRGM